MKLLPALLLTLPTAIHAADTSWLELGSEWLHYDNGQPASTVTDLAASHSNTAGQTLYGSLAQQQRFGRRDITLMAGAYLPLTDSGQLHLETSASPDPQLKPRYTAYAGWYQALPQGWTLEPGVQSTHYQSLRVDRYSLALERYFSNWRIAYHIADVHVPGSSRLSQRAQADFYYGESNRIGLGHAWGDDQESLPTGVITTPVSSFFVSGLHQLSEHVALLYSAQDNKQGSLYRSTGGRLGIRYSF